MKVKTLLFSLLAIGLAALIGRKILADNKKPKGNNTARATAAQVTGLIAQYTDFTNELSVSGSIEANEMTEIRPEVSGILEQINATEGSKVQKGHLLFKINDAELRAQLAQAKSRSALASENHRRAQLLLEREAISREEYDIAQTEWQATKAQEQLIQSQIARTMIRAPFSGTMGLRRVSPGAYVNAGEVLSSISNLDAVKITFAVPEKYVVHLPENAEVEFTIAGSKNVYKARVYARETMVDPNTRSLTVRALAQNPSGALVPGTFASVRLPLNAIDNAIRIPSQAIIPIQNGKKIFVVEKGLAQERIIQTGFRSESETVVLEGLKQGDTVLVSGMMALRPGTAVQVKIQ